MARPTEVWQHTPLHRGSARVTAVTHTGLTLGVNAGNAGAALRPWAYACAFRATGYCACLARSLPATLSTWHTFQKRRPKQQNFVTVAARFPLAGS